MQIFAGGDGTFNMVANAIAKQETRQILGVIPTGTINDAAKNFKITRDIKRCLKIIKNKKVTQFDICKNNDEHFAFTSAIGVFKDIPYAKKVSKKKFRRSAYYVEAIPSVFERSTIRGVLHINNEQIPFETPFFLVMNSTRVGGFKINLKSNIQNRLVDILYQNQRLLTHLYNIYSKVRESSIIRQTIFCDY